MKIAVLGAGAIGGLVAGYLKAKNLDVSLVGHHDAAKAIQKGGLEISGVRGKLNLKIEISEKLKSTPDLAIICSKTQDIDTVFKNNLTFLKDALILTTQNGVQADNFALRYVPKEKIMSSIVMFGATFLEPGKIIHNFEGSWIIGKIFTKNDAQVMEIAGILNQAFPTIVTEDLVGMKYLKIFVNANNCLAAILGSSMQESFSDLNVSKISIAIWKEGLGVMQKAAINLVSLPDFPLERLEKLTALPSEEAAKIFSGIMRNLSKEPVYGSILQSIKRKKSSEIEYINGEFVKIAKENQTRAPLNEKLVAMVHQVEESGKFFTKEELISSTKGLFN
ncbi:MAG: 2-dehydropantoate 2-reductase [Candidatus Omnitrophica bacterium]|nr:2-dehydropantoate 2-reductase [Candidatus Omnitrophota bacterium]